MFARGDRKEEKEKMQEALSKEPGALLQAVRSNVLYAFLNFLFSFLWSQHRTLQYLLYQ